MRRYLHSVSCRPIGQAFVFALFPLGFYLYGYLGYSRALKIALIGMAVIGSLGALRARYPTSHIYRYLLPIASFIIFANMSFHASMRDIFGIAQDDMMIIKALFGTDAQESWEFVIQYRYYIFKHISILLATFGLFYIWVLRCRYRAMHTISNRVLIAWILFALVAHLDRSMRISNPVIYFPYFYTKWQSDLAEVSRLDSLMKRGINKSKLSSMKYTAESNKNTVVWVIGESSTKSDWSLYGYERETTPMVESRKDRLLVFDNIYAAAPITVSAFERMLTPATMQKPKLWTTELDLLTMAKHAGYHVYWISNHTTDAYGIMSIFANRADEVHMTNRGKARGEGSYDASVLPAYERALADTYEKKLIIVHLLGSHPAYQYRYPTEYAKFTNSFDDAVAKHLSSEGIDDWAIGFRNLYDNSILYGDTIRYRLLELLEHSRDSNSSVWLYHPDHGEDVSHHTNFSGHNKNVSEQWEIPMLFWSPYPHTIADITDKPYRLDTIHNTILGLLRIEGAYYDPEDDIFSEEFTPAVIDGFDGLGSTAR